MNIKLQIIKVYQGTYKDDDLVKISKWREERHNKPRIEDAFNHPVGIIDIEIRNVCDWIALVLISHEPVLWKLSPQNEKNVRGIYISGYHPSDVCGEHKNCKILRINYGNREKDELIKEITLDTGYEVYSFQNAYNGKKFVVEG